VIDFLETQSFRQQALVIIAAGAVLLWSWGLFIATVVLRFGGNLELPAVLSSLVPVIVGTALAVWFYLMRMVVKVDDTGVSAEFKYVFFKKRYRFAEIESVFARKYSSLKEFGGWGVRSSRKNGMALNVSGNEGVQLIFKDGKRLLLGSRRATELEQAIKAGMDRSEDTREDGSA
jgi:hypothetical protein